MRSLHVILIALLGLGACAGSQGAPGTSANAVTSTSTEPAGTNCPLGGIRLDVGTDTNDNGALDPGEITGTS